jgi:hypothetical protein
MPSNDPSMPAKNRPDARPPVHRWYRPIAHRRADIGVFFRCHLNFFFPFQAKHRKLLEIVPSSGAAAATFLFATLMGSYKVNANSRMSSRTQ